MASIDKKLQGAWITGNTLFPSNNKGLRVPHHFCVYCREIVNLPLEKRLWRCKDCKMVHYHSRACQKADWETHKKVCRQDPTEWNLDVSWAIPCYK